jgi:hypothetical protein
MAFRFGWLGAVLVVLPLAAGAQSLGEVAKKEQERREKIRKAGVTTKPLTETDLVNSKGHVVNPTATEGGEEATQTQAAGGSGEGGTAPTTDSATATDEPPRETAEESWRRRAGHARARLANAQQQHEAMQQVLRAGQPMVVDENGRRVIYSNQQLKAKADAAQAALAAAQTALDNLLEDARRQGAQPGWLR